ncbi:zinc metalloprotease [Olivibacter sp. XZL3]|uniref:zinc metalloprotease n=1 Tax=Olivibacter sp. XZL3 TaxID=1735116 RepID=UPI00106610EA|nr:zinc metalloprotease [Olivibacter sp. XZL3]
MEQHQKRRHCATMEVFHRQADSYPEYMRAQATIESDIDKMLAGRRTLRLTTPAKIQVVVHVVYHATEENISDEQIQSQIDVLNADFRRNNTDRGKVPSVWEELAADCFIDFELAPDGITRTQTDVESFGTDNAVKSTGMGGIDPWPTDRYLNIWVCNLQEGLLGYAQFPGGPSDTDGVVVNFRAFGTLGTAEAPFNFGRTTTHEVGHYLNLSHIFGDGRSNTCADTDYVEDTPNQLGPNYGKPTFPKTSCNNAPNGDMFMNYMDYVDDDSMFMFTKGQASRMKATLLGPRASLLAAKPAIEENE